MALALAGSLIAVASAPVGAGLVLLSLLSLIADELLGFSIGRRLTPERASQNVVAYAAGAPPTGAGNRSTDCPRTRARPSSRLSLQRARGAFLRDALSRTMRESAARANTWIQ